MRCAENSVHAIDMFVQIVHKLFQSVDSTLNFEFITTHIVLNMAFCRLNRFFQIHTARVVECEFGVDFSERKKLNNLRLMHSLRPRIDGILFLLTCLHDLRREFLVCLTVPNIHWFFLGDPRCRVTLSRASLRLQITAQKRSWKWHLRIGRVYYYSKT